MSYHEEKEEEHVEEWGADEETETGTGTETGAGAGAGSFRGKGYFGYVASSTASRCRAATRSVWEDTQAARISEAMAEANHKGQPLLVKIVDTTQTEEARTIAIREVLAAHRIRRIDPESMYTLPVFPLACYAEGKEGVVQMIVEDGGESVDAVLHKTPARVTQDFIAKMWTSLMDGITLLHGNGCTLGDIHPGNIVVDPHTRFRFIDFSYARMISRGGCPSYSKEVDDEVELDISRLLMLFEKVAGLRFPKVTARLNLLKSLSGDMIKLHRKMLGQLLFEGGDDFEHLVNRLLAQNIFQVASINPWTYKDSWERDDYFPNVDALVDGYGRLLEVVNYPAFSEPMLMVQLCLQRAKLYDLVVLAPLALGMLDPIAMYSQDPIFVASQKAVVEAYLAVLAQIAHKYTLSPKLHAKMTFILSTPRYNFFLPLSVISSLVKYEHALPREHTSDSEDSSDEDDSSEDDSSEDDTGDTKDADGKSRKRRRADDEA
jgi:serine/threonine protein kinase